MSLLSVANLTVTFPTDAERVQCGREKVFRACSEFQSVLMLKGCADVAVKSAKRSLRPSWMIWKTSFAGNRSRTVSPRRCLSG